MATYVDPRLPLALLQAVRQLDMPVGDPDTEYVNELRNKRLGLSETVYAQIKRYTDAVRRSQRTTFEEAAGIARLLGRRADAEELFRAAGHHLAVQGYQTLSPFKRRTLRLLPSLVARPAALRETRRLAHRLLDGKVVRKGASIVLQVARPITTDSGANGAGCQLYATTLRELMRLLVDSDGQIEHVRCMERGEDRCEWRAEWRRKP